MQQVTYNPLNDPIYMSGKMKEFFKNRLREELHKLEDEATTMAWSCGDSECCSDVLDQGVNESQRSTFYAFHAHEQLLLRQAEIALRRLEFGNYGYCVVTGEPIGVHRLMVAPATSYCLDAQESRENMKH